MDLIHRELDVYIRLFHIYACTFSDWLWLTPQKNLFTEPPLYGEFDDGGCLKRQANLNFDHHLFIYINTGGKYMFHILLSK